MGDDDGARIEDAKAGAVRALANYTLYLSAQQSGHLRKAMKDQVRNVNNSHGNDDNNDDGGCGGGRGTTGDNEQQQKR
jgi:hypothetical protein